MVNEDYYLSPEWKAKRERRLEIDEYECRLCGATESLEVHHKPKAYADIPHERVEDLTTVCADCHHEAVTNLIRRRRYEGQIVTGVDTERVTPSLEGTTSDQEELPITGADAGRMTPPMERTRSDHGKVEG